jgi:hypothetical protein
MPNGDTKDYVIKTDGGTFRIRVPKGMEQAKALSLAAATNPKFAEIYPQVQARIKSHTFTPDTFEPEQKYYTSMSPTGIATSPRIPAKTQAEIIGGGLGGTAMAEVGAAAKVPTLLRMLGTASGAGFGAGAGNIAGGGSPKEALGTAGVTTAATMALEPLSPFLKWLTSSKSAGAKLLQQASSKAGKAAVELSPKTNEIVEKLAEYSKLGGKQIKVISDLLERVGPSTKQAAEAVPGPLTYDEARILQSNASQLTSEEQQGLKGAQKALMKQFAKSFGQDIQKTADAAGVGKQHAAGMKEYALASARNRVAGKVVKAAPYVGGAVAGYDILHRLLQQGSR